jgi:hypothetical protein
VLSTSVVGSGIFWGATIPASDVYSGFTNLSSMLCSDLGC